MRERARSYLQAALAKPDADFRDGQWRSIEQLLNNKRVLVVQRTGWGKSMVYFLASKLLREQGAGPTLLISPLLSLMRNQIEAAERIGVKATSINSTNDEEWDSIRADLDADRVDVLIISPERLANEDFRQNIMVNLAGNTGLFVVDEAHCISDWGHDFRPDYRRIVRVLQAIPPNVPVLATTATANDRVVNDVKSQLGEDIELIRGSLVRRSLKLQNITIASPAARMAWLMQVIPTLPGSGIVYTLTQRDAERVAEWLQAGDIEARPYHAGLPTIDKENLEQQLSGNEIKVLVATVALGMGFDKPDLGFVIHYQRPASVVHYYQQVGRAGRAVDEAYGVLLCGEEDDHIADYFIRNAFPPQQHVNEILTTLDASENGLSIFEMQGAINLQKSQIEKALKFLTIESPSPVIKSGTKWQATAAALGYSVDQVYIDEITGVRKAEQKQMQDYMQERGCLMAFLQDALDDPDTTDCGQCVNCSPDLLLPRSYDDELTNRAALMLRRNYQPIMPRKQWPVTGIFQNHDFGKRNISHELQAEEGRALCLWRDAGWGQLVAQGKFKTGRFSDELVTACVELLNRWAPAAIPEWLTCIPSLNDPALMPDFASRFADALGIPFVECIKKVHSNRRQKYMENSYQQVKNLDGVFQIDLEEKEYGPCLLLDDMVASRWTLTVASALLRQKGCESVYPLVLALNSPRMD